MLHLKNKKLAFFFTLGMSLELWEKIGTIKREVAIYNKLSYEFEKIYFFTYGNKNEDNER